MTSRSASPVSTTPSTPPDEIEEPIAKSFQPSTGLHGSYSPWRPSYHLMPRSGWMNDPCAPGYNPATGEHFVSFQWNPHGPDWERICWGTAFSKDLINWNVLDKPTLQPDTEDDGLAIFTGCAFPTSGHADKRLAVAYTSVTQLPIHHTLPHIRGSEGLAIATSQDNGRTWTKLDANPILPHEPDQLDVTGWRDPFVAPWPSMARALNLDDAQTLFGVISGGIRDVTPTSFLYTISPYDMTQWTYLGPLVDVGLNARLSRWSGDMGVNWEVTNFVTLSDDDEPCVRRDCLIMGTEGCLPITPALQERSDHLTRPPRGQLWLSGRIRKTGSSGNDKGPGSSPVRMSYDYGGHLDHGNFYAANSFFDPLSKRQVVWGWITEDDLCDASRHKQGWSGLLSLPRELRMQTIRNVVKTCASKLEVVTNIEYMEDDQGTYTIRTLGSQPVESVQKQLRQRSGVRCSQLPTTMLDRHGKLANFSSTNIQSTQWELQCSFQLSTRCRSIGLHIDHSSDHQATTTIEFDPSTETVTILRPSLPTTNSPALINASPEIAPHTLFTTRDTSTGREVQENLELQIWRDSSVLEVFVNGRTAISTRIYTTDELCGVRFFAEDDGDEGRSVLSRARVWDGIGVDDGKAVVG